MLAVSLVGRRAVAQSFKHCKLAPLAPLSFRSLLTTPPRSSPTPTTPKAAPAVEHLTVADNASLLNSQRLARPSSPHFTIYQPQITWLLSIANRVTGVGLSAGMYIGFIAYLAHPIYPAIDAAHLVELVSQLPAWLKTSLKFTAALPFTLHSFNGIRHLLWDVGYFLSVKQVTTTGWFTVGISVLSAAGLAFLL